MSTTSSKIFVGFALFFTLLRGGFIGEPTFEGGIAGLSVYASSPKVASILGLIGEAFAATAIGDRVYDGKGKAPTIACGESILAGEPPSIEVILLLPISSRNGLRLTVASELSISLKDLRRISDPLLFSLFSGLGSGISVLGSRGPCADFRRAKNA